jgi:hypothetical protein
MNLGQLFLAALALTALAALRWPQVGACALLVVDFLRPQDWRPELEPTRPVLVLAIATAGGLIVAAWRERSSPGWNRDLVRRSSRALLPWLALVVVAAISTVAGDHPEASRPAFAVLLKRAACVAIIAAALPTSGRLRAAGWLAGGAAAVLAAEALLRARVDGIPELLEPGKGGITGPPRGGVGGLFHDNNAFARLLALSIPLWALCWSRRSGAAANGRRALVGLGVALSVAGLIATYSRGGFVAGVAALGVALWRLRPWWRGAAGAVGAALALLLLLPPSYSARVGTIATPLATTSMQTRLHVWDIGLGIAASSPLVGVGPGAWRAHYPPGEAAYRSAHNVFVELAAELGALGLLAYVWILAATWRGLERLRRPPPDRPAPAPDGRWSAAAAGLQLSLVAFVVSGLTLGHPFWDPALDVLALSAALPIAAARAAPPAAT